MPTNLARGRCPICYRVTADLQWNPVDNGSGVFVFPDLDLSGQEDGGLTCFSGRPISGDLRWSGSTGSETIGNRVLGGAPLTAGHTFVFSWAQRDALPNPTITLQRIQVFNGSPVRTITVNGTTVGPLQTWQTNTISQSGTTVTVTVGGVPCGS